jgi:hypothetical protein
LFEAPAMMDRGLPLWAVRRVLDRELVEALEAVADAPAAVLDRAGAREMFLGLAEDGDTAGARAELVELLDLEEMGAGAWLDTLGEHVNTLGWAFWRLQREEERAAREWKGGGL